jgi:hypothetical protein
MDGIQCQLTEVVDKCAITAYLEVVVTVEGRS